jgi:hypothetical protein
MTGPQDGFDGSVSALRNHVDDLGVWLMTWETRQENASSPHTRRCVSDAVGAIDGAIKELHQIRARLITEIRVSDDAAAVRADKLLAESARRDPDDFPQGRLGSGGTEGRSALNAPAPARRKETDVRLQPQ